MWICERDMRAHDFRSVVCGSVGRVCAHDKTARQAQVHLHALGYLCAAGFLIYHLFSQLRLNLWAEPCPGARGCLRVGAGSMVSERRKGEALTFERGIAAHMMASTVPGRRNARVEDISEIGAKLTVEGFRRGAAPQGILPACCRPLASPTAAASCLGQWRSDRRQFPEAGRQKRSRPKRGAPQAAESERREIPVANRPIPDGYGINDREPPRINHTVI